MATRNNVSNATTANINAALLLGGDDLEMREIFKVANAAGWKVLDKGLHWWDAKISAYQAEIEELRSSGLTIYAVELAGADQVDGAVVIDHHNAYAGRKASLLQILDLLGLEPTRWQIIVAANDSGYIPGMIAEGATTAEIAQVRLLERQIQGITPEQESEAERAIAAATVVNGVTIIKMSHSKTATVCDRLFDPEKEQRLLILSQWEENGEIKTEVNFFGDWSLCSALYDRYGEEGAWHTWKGGETTLPSGAKTGFFGSSVAPLEDVEKMVVDFFAE